MFTEFLKKVIVVFVALALLMLLYYYLYTGCWFRCGSVYVPLFR